jgi:WD40 repeat protein
MTLPQDPESSSVQRESAGHAKATPPRRSRRWRLLGVAGLLLLLVCVGTGFWSQWSDYRTLGQHTQGVAALAFARDGKTLYSGCRDKNNAGTAGKAWEVATSRELHNFPGGAGMTLSPDGQLVATLGEATREIDVWETGTGTKRVTLRDAPTELWRMAISCDGTVLAAAGCNVKQDANFPTDTEPGEIGLWGLASGKKIRGFGRWDELVSGLSFAPDGKALASCSWDGSIQLWELATGSEPAAIRPKQEGGGVDHVTFNPDGRYLAAVARGDVLVWEVETRELIATLPWGGYGPPHCLTFSPDGRFLAAGGAYMQSSNIFRGCRVVLWEAGTWQKHSEVKGRIDPGSDNVRSLAFSPDGSRLALGSFRGYVGLVEVER